MSEASAPEAEVAASPSTATNLDATAGPTAFPSKIAVPPGYRRAGSTTDPIQKNKQLDFFVCIGIIFAVGAVCAIILTALHFGVLTHGNFILNPDKNASYPKLKPYPNPKAPAPPAPTKTAGPTTTANPDAAAAATTTTTTTTAPVAGPAPPPPPS